YILVIVELVAINWIYGTKSFVRDIKVMLGAEVGICWKVCWFFFDQFCWFVFDPVALFGILVYFLVGFELPAGYPDAAIAAGWVLFSIAIGMLPLCFCHAMYIDEGNTLLE
ncbi:unnamed protein product, partial [Meganyctiphanes norvegica]